MKRKLVLIIVGLIIIALSGSALWWKGVFAPSKKTDTGTTRKALVRKQIITSGDLIAKALKAGEIDYETSLLYRTYAIFADQRLPEKYLGNVLNHDAGTSLFAEIIANKDRLSPDLLNKLVPYMARPNDPVSIFNQPGFTTASVLPVFAQAGTWKSLPAAGGLARVWTRSDYKSALDLDTYVNEVNQVWPKLRELIRAPIGDKKDIPSKEINPDEAIDIYIIPLPGPDPRRPGITMGPASGWTVAVDPISGRTSSAYNLINMSLTGDYLVGTIAHELFHASQDSYDFHESSWLAESTATWGKFRVLQKLGRSTKPVHDFLSDFFSDLDSIPLDLTGGEYHEYGAYLYFFFAQMEINDAIVSKVWESATSEDGAKAVDAVFKFKDHFREFALRNWNFEPVKRRYGREDRGFPDLNPPVVDPNPLILAADKKETLDKEVNRLTARYYMIKVPKGSDIKKVRVLLGGATANRDLDVDAIVTIEGKDAEVRHWSNENDVTFCLDEPDQKLREFVLIVSNPSMKEDRESKIEIEPTKKPCEEGWKLTVHYEGNGKDKRTDDVPEYGETKWTLDGTAIIEAPVIYLKDKEPELIYLHYRADEDPTWVKYEYKTSKNDPGTKGKGKLISFTGQAAYSHRGEQPERRCCCPPGVYSASGSHQGSGALKAGEGSFSMQIHGKNVERGKINLSMSSPLIAVTGQKTWRSTCGGTSGTYTMNPGDMTIGPSHWGIGERGCTGQVSRTPRGYTGKVQCSRQNVSREYVFPPSESERNTTINFSLEIGRKR